MRQSFALSGQVASSTEKDSGSCLASGILQGHSEGDGPQRQKPPAAHPPPRGKCKSISHLPCSQPRTRQAPVCLPSLTSPSQTAHAPRNPTPPAHTLPPRRPHSPPQGFLLLPRWGQRWVHFPRQDGVQAGAGLTHFQLLESPGSGSPPGPLTPSEGHLSSIFRPWPYAHLFWSPGWAQAPTRSCLSPALPPSQLLVQGRPSPGHNSALLSPRKPGV